MSYLPSIPVIGNVGLVDIPKIAGNFEALRCNEIGPAEPNNVVKGMWWLDTASSILKLCYSITPPPTVWLSVMDFSAAGCTKAHIAATTASASVHGAQQGSGNGFDADKLDTKHLADIIKSVSNYYIDGTGTLPFLRSDTEKTFTTYGVTLKEFYLGKVPSSALKFYFEMRKISGQQGIGIAIYRNDTLAGGLHPTTSNSYVPVTETITGIFSDGDYVRLKSYNAGYTANDGYVKNFRLLGTVSSIVTLD